MTRKDFELIASVLRESQAWNETILNMADALADTNPRFDRERFLVASGIEDAETVAAIDYLSNPSECPTCGNDQDEDGVAVLRSGDGSTSVCPICNGTGGA